MVEYPVQTKTAKLLAGLESNLNLLLCHQLFNFPAPIYLVLS